MITKQSLKTWIRKIDMTTETSPYPVEKQTETIVLLQLKYLVWSYTREEGLKYFLKHLITVLNKKLINHLKWLFI